MLRILSRRPSAALIGLPDAGGGQSPRLRNHCPTALAAAGSGTRTIPVPLLQDAGASGRQARPSSSNSRWKMRQGRDHFAREAKVRGLKSRAAFKLIEMDNKYKLFKKGALVVDLGYAPGSWSQVAMERTKPTGRVLGIDIIPAQPPRGVATIQGNFLSPVVRKMVKQFVVEIRNRQIEDAAALPPADDSPPSSSEVDGGGSDVVVANRPSYFDMGRRTAHPEDAALGESEGRTSGSSDEDGAASGAAGAGAKASEERLVDIVLSDMMMNTSGISFRDHAGSMDLCTAALDFANETLRPGGHFVCKFYQGSEDKDLEKRLKKLFTKVHREKPESSRSESKEAYFVALRRKKEVDLREIEDVGDV